MWRPGAILVVLAAACGGNPPRSTATPRAPDHAVHEQQASPTKAQPTSATPPPPPVLAPVAAEPAATGNHCDALSVAEISVDGLLDDWKDARVLTRVGSPPDGSIAMRCAWDGETLAVVLDVVDERVVRVKGGSEDRVDIAVKADGKPVAITVYPGNSMAKAKIIKPANVEVADSLQPKGFSVELAIPAAAIPGFSAATPAFDFSATFHDSDAATGGDVTPLEIKQPVELGDRKDLLDDFLRTVKLQKTDIKLDALVELDPDRSGKERIVAGGNVIGILTDQFAYVTLPVPAAADVKKIELLPLGSRGQQIVSALVRQTGNGGARDLLMLWTVWSGQLQPLVNIEVRKELGGNVLESTYRIATGPKPKKTPELVVEPKPAVGFTPDNFNEEPAPDADSIVLPWDATKSGIAYSLKGAEIERRNLPAKKPR